jgi:hypothetical protein
LALFLYLGNAQAGRASKDLTYGWLPIATSPAVPSILVNEREILLFADSGSGIILFAFSPSLKVDIQNTQSWSVKMVVEQVLS